MIRIYILVCLLSLAITDVSASASNTYDLKRLASYGYRQERAAIVVVPNEQRLYVIKKHKVIRSYPISTSKYGLGNLEGSFKTPTGMHRIKQKIGMKAKKNEILRARKRSGIIARINRTKNASGLDILTSRIMWLEGLELHHNKGARKDSYNRYIYLHGTDQEGRIGEPSSDGCVRLKNKDAIELFSIVREGTLVDILPIPYYNH